MKGDNPKRPLIRDGGASLWVQEVFPTLQGEGPFAGQSAVFVRLGGCNLACFWCDTEFESSKWKPDLDALMRTIMEARGPHCDLVVITGGEPFRQDIAAFVDRLLEASMRVQIETNGTLWVELPDVDQITIVCSPKTPRLHPQLVQRIDAYKYVLAHGEVDPEDGLPVQSTQRQGRQQKLARPRPGVPVWVMPRDDADEALNKQHEATAVASAIQHGHRLGLQLHKIVGLA